MARQARQPWPGGIVRRGRRSSSCGRGVAIRLIAMAALIACRSSVAAAPPTDADAALLRELHAYVHAATLDQAAKHLAQAERLAAAGITADARLVYDSVACLDHSFENEDTDGALARAAAEGKARAQAQGRSLEQVRFELCEGNLAMVRGELEQARAGYERGLELARRIGSEDAEAEALNLRGALASSRGAFREALMDLTAARTLFERAGRGADAAAASNDIAVLYARLGDHAQALRYYRDALRAVEGRESPADRAALLSNMAASSNALDRAEEADAELAEARRYADLAGDPMQIAFVQRIAGRVLLHRGQAREALAELEPARRYFAAQGDRERLAQIELSLAQAHESLGEQALALERVQRARAVFADNDSLLYLAPALDLEAKLLARADRLREAYAVAERARAASERLTRQVTDHRTITAQVALDLKRQQDENEQLRREVEAKQAVIDARDRARRWQGVAIASSLLALVLIASYAWRQVLRARRLQDLSLTDELTGLPNRRHILAYASEQLALARRLNDPVSLIVLDLDHFKRVNDEHGHAGGDAVLRGVATLLLDALRTGNRVGRLGGEEFLVVVPHADVDSARALAERVRTRIATTRIAFGSGALAITASLGVVTSPPTHGSVDALLAIADAALYEAKHAGRDRVLHEADRAAATPA